MLFVKHSVLFAAILLAAINLTPPMAAANSHNGGGFLNGLFTGGQRARDRQAAAAAAQAQRRANREIQTALNFFGFNVGVVDGIAGRNTRSAIGDFQQVLGLDRTGRLARSERDFLLNAYTVISTGDSEMNWQILANADGVQGMLKSLYLEENPFAQVEILMAEPNRDSMRAFCVNIDASSTIELVKAQFCNLRQLLIDQANYLAESGPDPQNLSYYVANCASLSDQVSFVVLDIRLGIPSEIKQTLNLWQQSSEMPGEQLLRLARICLGAGYGYEDASLTLASALVLSVLDEPTYTELTGYHIAFGIGYEGSGDFALAQSWLEMAAQDHLGQELVLTGQSGEKRSEIVSDLSEILAAAR